MQWFENRKKKQIIVVIKVIFINNMYILLKNIDKAIKNFLFAYLLIKKKKQKII